MREFSAIKARLISAPFNGQSSFKKETLNENRHTSKWKKGGLPKGIA
jgi:hypothetical protein